MKLGVIYNPTAGKAYRFARLARSLERAGNEIILYTTQKPGQGEELAQAAIRQQVEAIVVVGGDGTVSEVVQGMAGSDVPLVVYPAGTANVWCKQVKMPSNPDRAAKVITEGAKHCIDLGKTGDHYFLLMLGVGLDGEITQALDLKLKRRIGKLAYGVAALQVGFGFQGSIAKITLNPESEHPTQIRTRTDWIIATNAERYAVMKLAREAQLDDGQLELLVFQEKNLWTRLRMTLSMITSRSEHNPHIDRYQAHEALIELEKPFEMQIDGDSLGSTNSLPLRIECVPLALNVIIPKRAPTRLFSQKGGATI